MRANNWERLEIWKELNNKFDFYEFEKKCLEGSVQPLTPMEFAQKAGMLQCAATLYPDADLKDAYMTFITNGASTTPAQEVSKAIGCTSCDENKVVVVQQPSRGLGDTVAKITHATGLDKLSELYTNITGKDCGCKSRQEALNKLFPYGIKEDGV